jgi:hypothetical protein
VIRQGAMAHFRFGGGVAESTLNPLVALCLLLAIVLIFTQPRTKAITPFLIAFFTIPTAQILVLGGLHLTAHQILIMAVLVRMATSGGSSPIGKFAGGFNSSDKLVVFWTLLGLAMFLLQWMETQALVKSLGDLVVTLGGYLAARFLIPNGETVRRAVKVLALICVIQALCMTTEQFTRQNLFSSLGANNPNIRNGHVRSEGAMGTLYGGTYAGIVIPLFLWLWKEEKSRTAACAGLVGATTMVFVSHASTSWLALGASIIGLSFWSLRKQMKLVRWGLVALLVSLHLVMNGPVWSLIEKIDLTGGSSSYHRYMLVDNCIRHFSDWWFIGYRYYGDWGFDMWDLCNQFVGAALTGGLLTLIVFIGIFKRSFAAVGTARKRVEGNRRQEWLFWCQGSALFALVVASFGINYMVHLMMWFFVLLVSISATTFEATQPTVEGEEDANQKKFTSPDAGTGADLALNEAWRAHSI